MDSISIHSKDLGCPQQAVVKKKGNYRLHSTVCRVNFKIEDKIG
jgi:hypothetical protein